VIGADGRPRSLPQRYLELLKSKIANILVQKDSDSASTNSD
jgi:hypothetical protein